jgi:hypothetical protein
MTEIFVAIPLMKIHDRLNSPSIVITNLTKIKSLVEKIHPYLQVENIYWTIYNTK